MISKTEDILRPFGITPKYRSFCRITAAVEEAVCMIRESGTLSPGLYKIVADKCNCSAVAVERNIRSLAQHAWKVNRQFVLETAGYPLITAPTATEFIEMLANKILREEESTQPAMR